MPQAGTARDTRTRILDAGLARLGEVGIARLALDDVAAAAGCSRQTVYRHFANRDGLLAAVILREEQAFLEQIRAAVVGRRDLEDALAAALDAALRLAADHPLLERLLATEPEALLPLLTTGAGPVLSAAEPVVAEVLARFAPDLGAAELAVLSDVGARVIVSYATNPSHRPRDVVVAALASLFTGGVERLCQRAVR